ncbi:CTD small phosphatase-like protein [Actinidia chinensis var. chinensis]|uniref:CTD small phosphatase-like protein n=1 Tax=Actinidia chinensis var. chinensis TaxID=1590841 RepID=A0A2R6QRC3_ACTCC|nr:CTD small phosphatase-like protein [Actinidia chinensis var. chinensis]
MQTKKKVCGRNSSRDPVSPKVSKHQKKASENVQVAERKVTDIITSSARKQKHAGTHPKNSKEHVPATNFNTRYGMVEDDASNSLECKGRDNGTGDRMLETIFSPAFHISSVGGEIGNGVDFIKFFESGDQKFQDFEKDYSQIDMLNSNVMQDSSKCAMTLMNVTCPELGANLSPEVSAIYLSMKNSKLECVDEQDQDHMSTDISVEEDEYEEFDDFDPFFFIKTLPDLSSVVPNFRRLLLPKQTRSCPPTTLVLDLDETLVHSTLEPCDDADFTFPVNFNLQKHTVYVRCRPHLKDFMDKVAGLFEIIIFTASQSIYAEQLLNVLDPKRRIFRHRVYRESCVFVDGNYLKDLSVLGRDLARVIIIDNSPQAFGFQVDNGIPIESWFDDRSDQELLLLLPFLESLVVVDDVRPLIAKKYNLREKIAAAVCPSNVNRGDPFER